MGNPIKQGTASVGTSAVALTAFSGITIDNLRRARGADISVYSQAVRINYHPGAVGTEDGHRIAANDPVYTLDSPEALVNCRIRSETGTATVVVTLWA
jgi:hypothetical protein